MKPIYDMIALGDAIGVTRTAVDNYHAASIIPEADYYLDRNGKEFWLPETVEAFVSERKRMNEQRKADLEARRRQEERWGLHR
jgi:hypothetical protein